MASEYIEKVSLDLVERILKGDHKAEEEMVTLFNDGLCKLLYTWSRDSELVQDVSQDTWNIVLEKIRENKLENHRKLSSFILQIGKYQLLMKYRKNSRNYVSMDDGEHGDKGTEANLDDIFEQYQTTKLVRHIILQMPNERDREILSRYYLNEDSKTHLCEALGLSPLHFNRVIHRARQRFKSIWVKYQDSLNKNK